MKKGFTLIETILYISLLSILITGVFSMTVSFVYDMQGKPVFTDSDYELLIKNFHEE